MPGFIARFETPAPIKFKENGCDTEFEVLVKGAIYINDYDESAFGETENDQINTMKAMAVSTVEECLAKWHEGDKTLYFDGKDVLGLCLINMLKDKGITGSARIDDLKFSDEVDAVYQEQIVKPYFEFKKEKRQKEIEAAVEPHGPLTSVSYNLSSHGMMAGTSSGSGREIEWREDGSIIYRYTSNGGGKSFEREYKVKPETAQKIIDYVEDKELAALSKLDIEKPVMFDNFTSSTIVVTYDDRSVGGENHNAYCIQCGPSLMTFKTIEEELSDLLKECEESGECIKNEMRENPGPSFMGMKQMMDMIDMGGQPGHEQPLQMMGLVQVDPNAGKSEAGLEKWTCKCSQENTGKFCCECGEPKPSGWICSCGSENTGKFCMNCGKPKSVASEDGAWECPACKTIGNRGKFCAGCGFPKPE